MPCFYEKPQAYTMLALLRSSQLALLGWAGLLCRQSGWGSKRFLWRLLPYITSLPEKRTELSLKKGAIVTILIADKEINWSLARLNNKTGLIPKNFVRLKPIVGYMGYMSRDLAKIQLRQDGRDNSFLLRESIKEPLGNFALSVKYKGEISHYKIFVHKETERFFILEETFSTINSLMRYYRTHSIVKDSDVLLDQPISEATKFKTNTAIKSQNAEELSFEKGEIVTVTDYADMNWWVGWCKEQTGMFPVPYIEPISFPSRIRPTTTRHSIA